MICGFYHMIPPPTSEELTSQEPSLSSLPLTTALRISISGEGMELTPQVLNREGEGSAEQGVRQGRLTVPDDLPVDLRAKLAVAMINLGLTVPEVRTDFFQLVKLTMLCGQCTC